MYGLLGLEQVFLRYSHPSESNAIKTQNTQFRYLGIVALVTSVLGSVIFQKLYPGFNLNGVVFFLAVASMVTLLIWYNIVRLNSQFVFAQILSNFWKIALLPIAVVLSLIRDFGVGFLYLAIGISILISSLFGFISVKRKISFSFNEEISPKNILSNGTQFFIAITAFSLLMFADRFIIEHRFGIEELGNYFYLTNFFLAPYAIFQNYAGFRQLILYKTNFSWDGFIRYNNKILIGGIVLGFSLFLLVPALGSFLHLNFPFNHYYDEIAALLFLGVTRLFSAGFTSAFEARTSLKTLKVSNSIFLLVVSSSLLLLFYFATNIVTIVVVMALVWLIRCFVLYLLLKKKLL